jgi:fucose 4-O-acetylase-like acetyltransferase
MTFTQRVGWIDSAKGVGIVLVVIGHAWRGLQTAGLIDNQALYSMIDTAIYAFHMPFFFFLSGLLIERTLLAATPGAFVLSRVQRLIWPLVLWTWIFFLFRGLAGGLANRPFDWATFPIIPLPPLEHFWFLWALFVIQLSLLLARPILQNMGHRAQVWGLLWLGSVVLYLTVPGLGTLSVWLWSALANAPFFLLGAATAGLRHHRPPIWVGGLAFLGCLVVIASAFYLPDAPWARLVIGSSATLLLCFTVMALEQPVLSRPALRWVAGLGTASLAIYVSHTIFSAAARIALLQAGVTDIVVHMVVGTLVGLLCPAVLYGTARRVGLSAKLGL